MLNTPVVLFCFNRPSETKKVFAEIKKIKPFKIFLVMDGPRKNNKKDIINCLKVRKIISNINWNCRVHSNFSKINLGLKKRFTKGLKWVFSKTKSAIILEDDCLPSKDFFYFCETLLNYYNKSKKVKFITGNCFQNKKMKLKETYYFSKYSHIWGWAAWRETWKMYNDNDEYWDKYLKSKKFDKICENKKERQYWRQMFKNIKSGELKSWAFYMLMSMWKNQMLTATPKINLVKNLGFKKTGTNTKKIGIKSVLSKTNIDKPIIHPKKILINKRADEYVFNNVYNLSFEKKIINTLKSFIN